MGWTYSLKCYGVTIKKSPYAHPMNDSTTTFAVPKSRGNTRAEDASKHSAVSRGEIAECGCEVVGRVGQVMLPQSLYQALVTIIFLSVYTTR